MKEGGDHCQDQDGRLDPDSDHYRSKLHQLRMEKKPEKFQFSKNN